MILPVYSFLHSASHLIHFVNIYSQPVMNRMIWRCQSWIRNNSCPEFSYTIYLNKTNSKRKDTITLKVVVAVQLLSCVWLFVTSWTAAHQVSLSITISWSLFKFMSIWVSDAIQPSHPLAVPFSFCPHSFPASGSFPVSGLFTSGGQSIGASASILPVNIQRWFPVTLKG